MKKLIIFLALTLVTFAETVKIDIEKIIVKHPKYESVISDLEKEKLKLQEVLDFKQKEFYTLEATLQSKGETVTETETENYYKMKQDLETFFSKAQNDLLTFKNQKMQGLYTEILSSMDILQKQKKYDAIVDSEAIFVGKDNVKDISEEVIKLLKGTEKINLF